MLLFYSVEKIEKEEAWKPPSPSPVKTVWSLLEIIRWTISLSQFVKYNGHVIWWRRRSHLTLDWPQKTRIQIIIPDSDSGPAEYFVEMRHKNNLAISAEKTKFLHFIAVHILVSYNDFFAQNTSLPNIDPCAGPDVTLLHSTTGSLTSDSQIWRGLVKWEKLNT